MMRGNLRRAAGLSGLRGPTGADLLIAGADEELRILGRVRKARLRETLRECAYLWLGSGTFFFLRDESAASWES